MKGIHPLDLKIVFVAGEGNTEGQQGGAAQQAGTEVVWANSMLLSMRSQFFQSALTWPKQEEGANELKEDGQVCELRKVDSGWLLPSTEGMVSAEAGSKRRRGGEGQRMDVKHEAGNQPTCQAMVLPVKESVQVYTDAADLEAGKKIIRMMQELALPASERSADLTVLDAAFLIKMLKWADMWSSPECIKACLGCLSKLKWTALKRDDVELLTSLPETVTSTNSYTEVRHSCATWLLQTFQAAERRCRVLSTGPVAQRPVRSQISEVQQEQLSQFCCLSLPTVQVFVAATKPNAYNAYFLATWIWANHAGEAAQDANQEPSTVPAAALHVGMQLLSSDHINSLLSAPSGVPPALRLLCVRCMVQKFGDVQQVVADPQLRASFCKLCFAAVKRWAMSDDLVCTFGEHDIVFAVSVWHHAQAGSSATPIFELASVVRIAQLSRSLRHALLFFPWWPQPELTAAFNAVYEAGASAAPHSDADHPTFPSAWTNLTARQSVPPATADARAQATVAFTHQQLSSALGTEQRSEPFYARGCFWQLVLELKDQGRLLWVSLAPSGCAEGSPAPPAVHAAFHISLQLPDGALSPTQASSPHLRWFLKGQGVGGPALGEAAAQEGRPIRSVHDFRHLLSPHGDKSKKGLVFRCSVSSAE